MKAQKLVRCIERMKLIFVLKIIRLCQCWLFVVNCTFAGEGVDVAVSAFIKDAKVYKKEYCGYVELRRPVFQKAQSYSGGEFKVLTLAGQNGISYSLPDAFNNHITETW